MAVGQGRGFGVSGGKAPYTVVSANPGIARVEARTNIYMVWGVAPGSTQITVTDAAGAKVQGTVHVSTTKPLSLSGDSTILVGGKGELIIGSGNPPYTVTTSPHLSAALKGNDAYGRTVYTLTAKAAGQSTVTVRDGKGQTASRTITVKEWVTLSFPQLTAEPRALDVGQTTPLSVSGGKPPYTVTASNPGAVTIQQQSNGHYSVTGRQAGAVGIDVMPPHHWLRFGFHPDHATTYFQNIYDAVGLDLICHVYPAWTKASYSSALLAELARLPYVQAFKVGQRDMSKYARDIKAIRDADATKAILTCHDEYLLASMVQGVDGALVGGASLKAKDFMGIAGVYK